MGRKQPSHFRMSLDDESSDELIEEEIIDRRIEKMGHRITLVSILIPVLVAVVLVLAYLDLTNRVTSFHDSGSTEVDELSKSLEDRFSSLSVKQAKLTETAGQLAATVKSSSEKQAENLKGVEKRLQDTLGQTQQKIEQINRAKADKKELEKSVGGLQKRFSPIQENLKSAVSDLTKLEKNFKKELTHLNGSLADFNELLADLNKRIESQSETSKQLQADLASMSSDKVSRNDLRSAFEEEKLIYRQMVSLITKNIEGKIEALRKEIEDLRKANALIEESMVKAVEAEPAAKPAAKPEKPVTSPSASPPEPGKIVEQNLQ